MINSMTCNKIYLESLGVTAEVSAFCPGHITCFFSPAGNAGGDLLSFAIPFVTINFNINYPRT